MSGLSNDFQNIFRAIGLLMSFLDSGATWAVGIYNSRAY